MRQRLLSHLPYLAIIWILGFGIYLYTRAPSILYVDAGTHIAAAYTLGISNPPGFPLYIIVGHLFTKLPFGDPLFQLQLLSIISAVSLLTILYFLIHRFLATDFWFVDDGVEDSRIGLFKNKVFGKVSQPAGLHTSIVRLISLGATITLGFSYQFWSQTLNTESYILTNLAMVSLLALAIMVPKTGKIGLKRILFGSVILGLASGLNPTIIQSFPALAIAAVFLWKRVNPWHVIPAVLLVATLTAAIYSYLPLRARTYPFTNWGNPQTWELFWGHIRGEGLDIYDPRTNSINGFTGSPKVMAQSTGRYLYLALVQFTPVLVPFVLFGMYYMLRKNWRLFTILIAIPIINAAFGALYLSGNQESWFIASYVIFSIFLAAGLAFLAKLALAKRVNLKIVASILLLISALPFAWWLPKLNRSSHVVTSEYAQNLYRNIPNDGKSVLIGSGDFFNSLSHYMYSVKGKKGVFPVTVNMWYILPWYRDNLRHHRPDIMPEELEKMIKMDRVEEYNEVLNWWIEWLLNRGFRVYVTPLVFRETVIAGTNEGKFRVDKKRLRAIPYGLTFRMLHAHDLLQASEDNVNFKFKDPEFYKKEKRPFYLERNYIAGYNILLREYAFSYMALAEEFVGRSGKEHKALADKYFHKAYEFAPFAPEIVNRLAIYYRNQGNLERASELFLEALALEPDNVDLRINAANILAETGQLEEAEAHFQYVLANAKTQEQYNAAVSGINNLKRQKIISQIPPDWQIFKGQEVIFVYPPDWDVRQRRRIIEIKPQEGDFGIFMFVGDRKNSPISISGDIQNQGPAQIPGFEATAYIWKKENGQTAIEFVLVRGDKTVHVVADPLDQKFMSTFDKIISTLQFVQ